MTLSHETTDAGPGPGRTGKTLRRGAITIAYTAEGAGRTILLVPSLGRGAEDFDPLVPLLVAAGFRILCPEPRGIGGSSPLGEGDTLHDMAADLAALVEHDGAGPVLVAGHAAGNWTARVLAHDRPDLVRGVALLAAVIADDTSPDMKRSITASFDTSLPDWERLHHLRRAYFAPGHDATPWLSGWHTAVARAQRQAAAATTDRGWRRSADRIPTLYVAARQDTISPPPTLAELRDRVGPQATLAIVEGAGHALLPEQPAAVAESLVRWSATLD